MELKYMKPGKIATETLLDTTEKRAVVPLPL
jgi:hypothetical protein